MPSDEARLKALEDAVSQIQADTKAVRHAMLGDFDGSPSMIHQHRYHVQAIADVKIRVECLEQQGWLQKGVVVVLSVIFSSVVAYVFRKL